MSMSHPFAALRATSLSPLQRANLEKFFDFLSLKFADQALPGRPARKLVHAHAEIHVLEWTRIDGGGRTGRFSRACGHGTLRRERASRNTFRRTHSHDFPACRACSVDSRAAFWKRRPGGSVRRARVPARTCGRWHDSARRVVSRKRSAGRTDGSTEKAALGFW